MMKRRIQKQMWEASLNRVGRRRGRRRTEREEWMRNEDFIVAFKLEVC